jgi:hypothetical protein
MSSSAIRLTRFKIPKIKFPLTREELLVIFLSSFTSYILDGFRGKFVYWPLFLAMLFVGVWSYTILNTYTIKEMLSTGAKKKKLFFSENFTTDLLFYLFGNVAGFVFTALLMGDGPVHLITTLFISMGMRCLARWLYYNQ